MNRIHRKASLASALAAVAALAIGAANTSARPVKALAPPNVFTRVATVNATTAPAVAMARTSDGTLHLVFQTFSGRALSGLASISITPGGAVGPQVQALAGWQAGQPGLVSAGGQLQAIFGAVSPDLASSVWEITSTDGGASWSAPSDVRGGGSSEALAYGSDVTAAVSGTTPIVALPQGGNLFVQSGLGGGSPSYQVTTAANGSMTDADLAVDAATGHVVAGWSSVAHAPTLYAQSVAPAAAAAQAVPGQARNALVLAGRDQGPGVFAAYTQTVRPSACSGTAAGVSLSDGSPGRARRRSASPRVRTAASG